MRVTVKLDEDVAAEIRSEMGRSGESFKQVVNRLIRLAFDAPRPPTREESGARTVRRGQAR
jgi:hypothetical protein